MIQKGIRVGNVTGVTVVELGDGDVIVSSASTKEYAALAFVQDNTKRPIGHVHETKGKSTDETGLDVMIRFDSIESLEVVQRMLDSVRKELM